MVEFEVVEWWSGRLGMASRRISWAEQRTREHAGCRAERGWVPPKADTYQRFDELTSHITHRLGAKTADLRSRGTLVL